MSAVDRIRLWIRSTNGKMTRAYIKPKFSLGHLLARQAHFIQTSPQFSGHQKRTLKAIAACRTAALGAHKIACTDCGNIQLACNSCRNRSPIR